MDAGDKIKLEIDVNSTFCTFVRGNKYIRRALSEYSKLFRYSNDVIIVDLSIFIDSYLDKFVRPSFAVYCNKLLDLMVVPLQQLLERMGLKAHKFVVKFKLSGLELVKELDIKI